MRCKSVPRTLRRFFRSMRHSCLDCPHANRGRKWHWLSAFSMKPFLNFENTNVSSYPEIAPAQIGSYPWICYHIINKWTNQCVVLTIIDRFCFCLWLYIISKVALNLFGVVYIWSNSDHLVTLLSFFCFFFCDDLFQRLLTIDYNFTNSTIPSVPNTSEQQL